MESSDIDLEEGKVNDLSGNMKYELEEVEDWKDANQKENTIWEYMKIIISLSLTASLSVVFKYNMGMLVCIQIQYGNN